MNILSDLTENQRMAVEHIDGPMLVLAGAGSGKTRVVTRRIGHLIEQGISPYSILAITFTNKAAGEMRERVTKFSNNSGLWVSTFHAMCARILRTCIDRLGYSNSFSIYDMADQISVIKAAMTELQLDPTTWRPGTVLASISHAKNGLLSPEALTSKASDYYNSIVSQVYTKYQSLLLSNNALDFDDLLVKVIEVWKQHKDVLESYQERFRFILVDEYQDTNHSQYVLLRMLAERYKNICATGDPDQSIYGWRGADMANILTFEEDYPNAKVIKLEQNYRSTKTILAAASEIIKNNEVRKPKDLWTDNPEGNKIRLIHCKDEHVECKGIASLINDLKQDGMEYSDIALFYRTNAQSRVFEFAFRDAKIPYVIVDSTAFFQRMEIKDLIAYLKLCVNPSDEVALKRIINVPPRGIGKTTVERLRDFSTSSNITLLETLSLGKEIPNIRGKTVQAISDLSTLFSELTAMPPSPVGDIVKRVIDVTRYKDYLTQTHGLKATERIENVEELVNAASEYDTKHNDGSLSNFLEDVALVSDTDKLDEQTDVVTLMTLHSAKGLEFPVVFLTGMEEGLLPHKESKNMQDEIEEERRLLYVGITRAQKELILTYAKRRTRYGQITPCLPSRFLGEIPPEILEEIDETCEYEYDYHSRKEQYYNDDISTDLAYEFRPGDIVRHPHFGIGRIIEIFGSRENTAAFIKFNIGGKKQVLLEYARLERM
jgi:DNA helicase-2/ATP-dependent DNA helicase PcrA